MLKLRWKLLILLLVVAVLPIFIVRVVDALSTRRLGQQLANHASQALARSAEQQLGQLINNYTEALEREERLLKLMLAIQAEQVERRLAEPPPSEPPSVFFAEAFDEQNVAIPGLTPSTFHATLGADGTTRPQSVSYDVQAIHLSPGVERNAVQEQIDRMAAMTEAYRSIRSHFPEAVLWQYTTLADGVHGCYPGKGGYPPEFEPRQRPWYVQAATRNEVSWLPPAADLSTGRATMTLAEPVHGPGGEVRGVTAIDVPVTSVLGRPRMNADWSEHSHRYLITIEKTDFIREIGLEIEGEPVDEAPLIFAESTQTTQRADWHRPTRLRVLEADDSQAIQALMEKVRASEAGSQVVEVDGVEHLWAWGVIGDAGNVALLVTVPRRAILAEAERMESQSINAMLRSLQNSAVVVVIVLGFVALVAWRSSRAVSRPIMEMADAAREVADGDFEQRVTLRQRIPDELTEMAEAFNDMVPQLSERLQMRQSLNLAMEVQQSLLPSEAPRFEGVDLAGQSVYCDETGGDYYDFLQFEQLGDKQLGVVIGDVVGHGVAAALLMATTRALLRSRVVLPSSLEQVFNDVNVQLCAGEHGGRFMTMFYLLLDTESKQLRWLSAGHDPAIVYDPQADAFDEMVGRDVPLGLRADWQYTEVTQQGWAAGTIIVIGTDGIWEARDRTGDMFGKDRLRQVIREHANRTSEAITRAIHEAVRQFRGNVDQQDDITLVVIRMTE